ncbi:MAG: hypothetical protein NTU88_13295, partial [Armatimonadetes bacterium]|nr:hypothetical protein [Armatimonadota bacterium]
QLEFALQRHHHINAIKVAGGGFQHLVLTRAGNGGDERHRRHGDGIPLPIMAGALNGALDGVQVENIYFTSFAMQ